MAEKNYIACNVKPLHMADIAGIEAEKRRELEEYTNSVDLSRTPNNEWYIGEHNEKSCSEIVEDRFKEYNQEMRANTRCAMNLCFRVSDDFKGNRSDVWKRCLEFVNEQGFEPILAVAHKDEINEHFECLCIPTTKQKVVDHREPILDNDGNKVYYKQKSSKSQKRYKTKPIYKKDENGRVVYKRAINYKNIFGTRTQLSNFQTKLAKEVGEQFGLRRGKCRIATSEKKKALTDAEYQEKKLKEKVQKQELQITSNDVKLTEQEEQIKQQEEKIKREKSIKEQINRQNNEKIMTLNEQDRKINERERKINEQKKTLEEQEQQIKNNDNYLEKHKIQNKALNDRELQLNNRERDIEVREKVLVNGENELEEKKKSWKSAIDFINRRFNDFRIVVGFFDKNKQAFEKAPRTAESVRTVAQSEEWQAAKDQTGKVDKNKYINNLFKRSGIDTSEFEQDSGKEEKFHLDF